MKIEKELEKYFDRLFPICRSITGSGYQESLDIIREMLDIKNISLPNYEMISQGAEAKIYKIIDNEEIFILKDQNIILALTH